MNPLLSLLCGLAALTAERSAPLRPDETLILRFPAPMENYPGAALGLLFSADGKTIAAFDGECTVCWDASTGAELHYQPVTRPRMLRRSGGDLAVIVGAPGTPDGRLTNAVTGETKSALVFPATVLPGGADARKILRYPSHMVSHQDNSYVGPLSIAPSGARAACVVGLLKPDATSAFSEGVWIFQVDDGAVVQRLAPPRDPVAKRKIDALSTSDPRSIRDVAFSADGKAVAAVAFTGTVVVWNCADGKVIHTLAGERPQDLSWPLRLLPEGDSSVGNLTAQLVWVEGSGALLTLAPRPELDAPGLRRLVKWTLNSTTPKTLEWIGAMAGKSVQEQARMAESSAEAAGAEVPQARFIVCSPDGTRAIAALEESKPNYKNYRDTRPGIELVDLHAGRPIGLVCVPPEDWVTSIAYSPDSRRVALGMKRGAIFVVPMTDLEAFAAHQRSVAEIGSTRPVGRRRIAGAAGTDTPATSETPSPPPTPGVEFDLLGTGILVKTDLDIVEQHHLPLDRVPNPKSVLIAGSAVVTVRVHRHSNYAKLTAEYKAAGLYLDPREQSAEAAFKPFLDGRRRATGMEFVDEIVSTAGALCHIYTPADASKLDENALHWREMHAVIEGDVRDVWISIVYPIERDSELRAPLREMLLGLRKR